MSDPLQLQRRASQQGQASWFLLPGPPILPPSLSKRFPELVEYNQAQARWWGQFMATAQRVLTGGGQQPSSSTAQTLTPEMLEQIAQQLQTRRDTVTIIQARARYIHHQDIPAVEWPINHGLDGFPIHMIVDASGHVGYGDVYHLNQQQSVVRMGAAFSGKAYLLN